HLQIVGEPIYHKDTGRPRPEPPRRRRRGYVRELVTTTESLHRRAEASVRTTDGTRAGTHSGPRIPGERRPPTRQGARRAGAPGPFHGEDPPVAPRTSSPPGAAGAGGSGRSTRAPGTAAAARARLRGARTTAPGVPARAGSSRPRRSRGSARRDGRGSW